MKNRNMHNEIPFGVLKVKSRPRKIHSLASSFQAMTSSSARSFMVLSFLIISGCIWYFNSEYNTDRTMSTGVFDLDYIRRLEANCTVEETSSDTSGGIGAIPKPALYTIIVVLIFFSAFFSGLTLALMSLDTTGLEIVMAGDDPKLSRAASKIYPMRKDGNLLLCTLLLGNVSVNTLLGILMADLTSGTVGFVTSTALIVIFGEILPQASFARYALEVGEYAVPVMRVIIIILYIFAKPLALCLDKLLGHELATVYSKSEFSKLLEIHAKEGYLNPDEEKAMRGALQYQDMTVEQVMTPLEETFMVDVESKLNFETMATIFKTGYSRIPVYENHVHNVIGLLFVKDLIFINANDEMPVRDFIKIFGRGANVVWLDDKLGDVLTYLKKGHSHMALVRDVYSENEDQDPIYIIKGIITMEDIIEVILGDDIMDETDAWEDAQLVDKKGSTVRFDFASLRLLNAKIVDKTLSDEEVKAVVAHLSKNFSTIFSSLSEKQLSRMVAATPVIEIPEAKRDFNEFIPRDLLYENGKASDVSTLILGGKVTVISGRDNFRSDISSWSLLATGALTDSLYSPDFTAFVSRGPCRCLQFKRALFNAAVQATEFDALPSRESGLNDLRTSVVREEHSPSLISSISDHSELLSKDQDVVEHRTKLLNRLLSQSKIKDDPPSGLNCIEENNHDEESK